MAQHVGYWDNHVVFKEGPFVLTNPMDNGYRVEVENKRNNPPSCPTLPMPSVYKALKASGFDPHKTSNKQAAEAKVDWLNKQTKTGKCILGKEGVWQFPEFDE